MSPQRLRSWLAWCAPLAFLGAVALGVWITRAEPPLFGLLLALLALVPVGWVLVSSLWPARAERGCPACRKDALVRADPRATHGLVCRACGWRDESASAWLLAEEEGPLEELVLAERRRRAAERRAPTPRAARSTNSADVDSPRPRG
jgi:hypothetical protein